MKKIKYLTILLLLLISPISVKADIVDFNKKGTITIELIESTDNNKVSDAEITIYKLADAIDLNNNLSFEFISELNECNVNLMELKEVTTELNDCIKDKTLPSYKGITNNEGIVKFNDLDLGLYLVKETKTSEKYSIFEPFLLMIPLQVNNNWTYDILSNPKTDIIKLIDIIVKKEWNNDTSSKLPEFVTIELLKDNEVIDKVILNKENNWTYTWKNIEKSDKYKVSEIDIPTGYTPTYRNYEYTFIVTNTNTLIKTGTNTILIELSLLLGLVLIITGILYNKKVKHE